PARARDSPLDEILRDGGEVVVHHLAMRLETRFMPRRTELTAAADVREYPHSAMFKPQLADVRRIIRRLRHLEPAVGIEDRWIVAVQLHAAPMHHKVRYMGAILGRRLELLDDVTRRIELGRERLDRRQSARLRVHQPYRARSQESGNAKECRVRMRIGIDYADGEIVRELELRPCPPARACWRVCVRASTHIVELRDDERVLRRRHPADRLTGS